MFRITAVPDLNNKRPPTPWRDIQIFKIEPGAFVICITSDNSELSLDAKTDGAVLYSPWGEFSKIDFTLTSTDTQLTREFLQCRAFDLIDLHLPNSPSKYFISKVLLPEDNWSQTEEDRLIESCQGWIYREEWRNSSPIGTLTQS